jgi:hypothetical protein
MLGARRPGRQGLRLPGSRMPRCRARPMLPQTGTPRPGSRTRTRLLGKRLLPRRVLRLPRRLLRLPRRLVRKRLPRRLLRLPRRLGRLLSKLGKRLLGKRVPRRLFR